MVTRSRLLFGIILVQLFVNLIWLGQKPFYSRGEPREALVAQSMLSEQEWILPHGYGGAVPSKPPFLHWLVSAASVVQGEVTELTARLPSALGALLFLCGFAWYLSRRTSVELAATTVLILMTSIEWWRASLTCRVDMLLACALGGGVLFGFEWLQRGGGGKFLMSALLLSGATLAKGPVALILSGGILFLERVWATRQFVSSALRVGVLCLLALAVASLWYVAAYHVGGEAFWQTVYHENFARFTSSMLDDPHNHSVLYLYGTVLLGFLPWTLVVLPAFLWHGRYIVRHPREWGNLNPVLRLAIVTSFVCLLFFSIPASKRSVYLLPAYPFFALLIASGVLRLGVLAEAPLRLLRRGLDIVLALLIVVTAVAASYPRHLLPTGKPVAIGVEALQDGMHGPLAVSLLLLFGVYVAFFRRNRRLAVFSSAAAMLVLYAVLNAHTLPALATLTAPRDFAAKVAAKTPKGVELYAFGEQAYATSFYSKRTVQELVGAPKPGVFIILPGRAREGLEVLLNGGEQLQDVVLQSEPVLKESERLLLVEVVPLQGER